MPNHCFNNCKKGLEVDIRNNEEVLLYHFLRTIMLLIPLAIIVSEQNIIITLVFSATSYGLTANYPIIDIPYCCWLLCVIVRHH